MKGAFLNSRFENGEKIFVKIPQGFEKYYPSYVVLKLLKTYYGLIQSAKQFWMKTKRVMKGYDINRNCVHSCLFYKWIEGYLVCVLVLVDDFLVLGPDHLVPMVKLKILQSMECEDVREMTEYVGCLVERDRENRMTKLTQFVKIQKAIDEFGIDPNPKRPPMTPAEPESVLKKKGEGEHDIFLNEEDQKMYRSAVATFLH